jgi:2'-5' RNA ligase
MPRMFIAVDLPAVIAAEAKAICRGLPAAHWSNFTQLHLTLRFLGEVPDDQLAALRANLRRISQPPFSLGLVGVGVFPHKRRPARVLWAGVVPEEPACALKKAIDDVLGPDPEAAERGYSPHLTLARFRDDPGPALTRFLDEHAGFASAGWPVDSFHLYRSTLGRDGAHHEIVESYSLAP